MGMLLCEQIFYKYIRYSVTITLQIEKYSLGFAHIGPDTPCQIKFEYGIITRQRFLTTLSVSKASSC